MDITQFLQSQGHSRRQIIDLLQTGCILHNNEVCSYRKTPVQTGDSIVVSPHDKESSRYSVSDEIGDVQLVLYNKPVGVVVSQNDPHNETIFTTDKNNPPLPAGLYPIGRLDKDSHGLLLLTNTPALVSALAHPRYDHHKTYRVALDESMSTATIEQGRKGIDYADPDTHEHMVLRRDSCTHLRGNTYTIVLTAGKKRHIRRLCAALGHQVLDLQRVGFAHWKLPENLTPGHRETTTMSASDLQNLLAN